MQVSAVIPTYNGLRLLQENLPAVLHCLRIGDEVVIVDDASTDHTVKWLLDQFKLKSSEGTGFIKHTGKYLSGKKQLFITLIVNQKNLRFGASVNRGVEQAKHPLIFLVNNDVSPQPTALEPLVKHFVDESVFAVSCLEVEPNQGGIWGGKNKLWFERGIFVHSRAEEFSAGPTAWASGGSALYDRAKWLELGGFDQAYYPAYWEDIDLSYRAKKRGWQVLFDPESKVSHNHESTNTDVFGQRKIEDMSWKHAHTFVQKNGTLWQKLAHMVWQPYWWWVRRRARSN